jgi:hypothetical protein
MVKSTMPYSGNQIGFVDLTEDEDHDCQRHVEDRRSETREIIEVLSMLAKVLMMLDEHHKLLAHIEKRVMMISRQQDLSRITFAPIGSQSLWTAGSTTDTDSTGEDSTHAPADDQAAPATTQTQIDATSQGYTDLTQCQADPVNAAPKSESSAHFQSRRNKRRQESAAVPPVTKRVKK